VLATVARILSDGGVSVETVQQSVPSTTSAVVIPGNAPIHGATAPTATLVIGTHEAEEAALAATVEALAASDVVTAVSSVLRVEGS
jgi:homoserine dehydrogenase